MVTFKEFAGKILSRGKGSPNPEEKEYRKALKTQYEKEAKEEAKRKAVLELGTPKQRLAEYEKQYKEKLYKKQAAQIERFRRYDKTRSGRFSALATKGLKLGQRQGVTRALYRKSAVLRQPTFRYPQAREKIPRGYAVTPEGYYQRRTITGSQQGRVGRPAGTYNKLYAQWGGVYGYRKMLAAKLRAQKFELIRQSTISPQQQMVINQMQSQQAYAQQNPENKIIPDTYGQVPVKNIWDEINNAANIIP